MMAILLPSSVWMLLPAMEVPTSRFLTLGTCAILSSFQKSKKHWGQTKIGWVRSEKTATHSGKLFRCLTIWWLWLCMCRTSSWPTGASPLTTLCVRWASHTPPQGPGSLQDFKLFIFWNDFATCIFLEWVADVTSFQLLISAWKHRNFDNHH